MCAYTKSDKLQMFLVIHIVHLQAENPSLKEQI